MILCTDLPGGFFLALDEIVHKLCTCSFYMRDMPIIGLSKKMNGNFCLCSFSFAHSLGDNDECNEMNILSEMIFFVNGQSSPSYCHWNSLGQIYCCHCVWSNDIQKHKFHNKELFSYRIIFDQSMVMICLFIYNNSKL